MKEVLQQPWPWYVAGALIGAVVPILLLLGNKNFGISANFRHTCAACFPSNIGFFKYNWKKESWNLFFAAGIIIGAWAGYTFIPDPNPVVVHPNLVQELSGYGITDYSNLVPAELVSWSSLFSVRGLIMMVGGGLLVGFGSRYAGGCTSGHSIMGIGSLQWPSLLATCCFMIGGILMANFILPIIMKL